jgi:hypothetical protein
MKASMIGLNRIEKLSKISSLKRLLTHLIGVLCLLAQYIIYMKSITITIARAIPEK